MLERAITEWRKAALAEGECKGRSEGMREGRMEGGRAVLRRLAARRSGTATGDALAALLGEVADARRLAAVGDLVADCASADELLRRSGGVLNGGRPT